MIENGILHIDGDFGSWKMQINLNELIRATGEYMYYTDLKGKTTRQLMMKQSEARKVLKFLMPYANANDIAWMDTEFEQNPVLAKIWRSLRG